MGVYKFQLLCLIGLTTWIIGMSHVVANEPLIIGIHPYKTAEVIHNTFTPIANFIADKIKRPVNIKISKDYQTHLDLIGKNNLDVAYMRPASYIKLVKKYGKKPILVRLEINGKPTFQGAIITGIKSTITSLPQLNGKTFAFGDPNSTMSHLVPRYMLIHSGVEKSLASYKFLGNHNNVALGVLSGHYDAGAVKEEVFYKYQNKGLKLITKTPSLSEHIFVTRSNLNLSLINTIRDALLKVSNAPDGEYILTDIKKKTTGLVKAKDSDYNNLRIIITTLENTGITL